MKRTACLLQIILCVMAASCSGEERTADNEKIKIIIETDMGNDIDDALALAMAFNDEKEGLLEVLAIGNHKDSPTATEFIDVLTSWYGCGNVRLAKSPTPVVNNQYTDYTTRTMEMTDGNGAPVFKACGKKVYEPVALYREILAGAEDNSVVFVSLGFGVELAKLLESGPDEVSPLDGVSLVAEKVRYLSVMAGSYGDKKRAEFNVVNDIPSMRKVFESWPTAIYQNPFEIGKQVMFPAAEIEKNLGYDNINPVVEAYKSYDVMPYDRPTWDLLSVLFVTNPELFTVSAPGTVTVDEKGYTHYREDENGRHYVLSATIDQPQALKAKILETVTKR